MTTALTVYGTNIAATTLSTAGLLVATAGGALSSCSSKIGTATAFGELYALSNGNPWPSLGAITPDGNGFLLDAATLNGQTIASGAWTPEIRVRVSTGTCGSVDFYIPIYKYTSSGGVFTKLGQAQSLANALTTAFSFPTFDNPTLASASFNPGDFLYFEVWPYINSNSTGSGAATMIMTVCSDTGNADNSIITPGYAATATNALNLPNFLWWWPQVGAAQVSGVGQPPPPPANLTGGWIFPGDSGAVAAYSAIQPKLDFIIAEYLTLQNTQDGTLTEEDDGATSTGTISQHTNAGVNAYSASNLSSIKQYSTMQFCDIAGVFKKNGGGSDSGGAAILCNSSSLQTTFINQVIAFLNFTGMTGIELDWERQGNSSMSAGTYTNYLSFMTTLGNTLHSHGYKLCVSMPAFDGASGGSNPESAYRFKLADFNSLPIDYLIPLIYDNEFNTSEASYSQASTAYITNVCNYYISKVTDKTRIIAGISGKGYSDATSDLGVWNTGPTDNLTKTQLQAVSGYPGTRNSLSQEMQFTTSNVYYDYNDTTTLDSHKTTIYNTGVLHISVWYLGSGYWF